MGSSHYRLFHAMNRGHLRRIFGLLLPRSTMNDSVSSQYDESFYAAQLEESLAAARIYVAQLGKVFAPASVLDVGCGRGPWLKAFREAGAERLVGLDGVWNQGSLLDPAIDFRPTDLEQATRHGWSGERFDLAMSVEVAEHLPPETSRGFAELLCSASDIVMFGAAIPHQGGTHHVNLRPQSAWAAEFAALGFDAWDLFRPTVWGHAEVPYWYQQNTFLYVKSGHALEKKLKEQGISRITRPEVMDTVHPDLLAAHAEMSALPSAKRLAKLVLPDAIVRRLTR